MKIPQLCFTAISQSLSSFFHSFWRRREQVALNGEKLEEMLEEQLHELQHFHKLHHCY